MSRGAGRGSIPRRQLLKAGVGLATGLSGCFEGGGGEPTTAANGSPSTPAPGGGTTITERERGTTTPDIADRFDAVVDLVSAGADPGGDEPITAVLQEHASNDTLVYLRDGTYAIDALTLRGLRNVGVVAAPGAAPTIVPNGPEHELGSYLLTFIDVRDFHMEGLRFDFRREGYGGRVQVISSGDFTVRDVETVGEYPDEVTAFRFDVRAPDGTGLVERLVANSTRQTNRRVTGLYVGAPHSGELTFRDCDVQGFPDNGLYASAPGGAGGEIEDAGDGPVHVEGGLYRNNNVANVRLGSTGSTARGVTIVVDETPPHLDDTVNARGIRLRGKRDQVVEDCDIRLGPGTGYSFGGIVLHHDNGRAFVRNTRIEVNNDDTPAINALRPDTFPPTGPVFENVVVTGSASNSDAAVLNNRDGTTFRGCCIQQSGTDRNGIRFVDSEDCVVTDSVVDVTGRSTIRLNSSVTATNVRYSGGC